MKSSELSLLHTGICEDTYTKRTLVSLITGLKQHLPAHFLTVQANRTVPHSLTDVVTENRCIYLKGHRVRGRPLYQICRDLSIDRFNCDDTRALLRYAMVLMDASERYNEHTGGYPPLLLNSIHISDNASEVTFLPYSLVDFLNTFHSDTLRKDLYLPLRGGTRKYHRRQVKKIEADRAARDAALTGEYEFTRSLVRLLYFCLTNHGKKNGEENARDKYGDTDLYLRTVMEDAPVAFADILWDVMHGQVATLNRLREIISSILRKSTQTVQPLKIPFMKRKGVIHFKRALSAFFIRGWKYIAIVLIICGVGGYLLSDVLKSRIREDYTAGLSPRQVVELYYQAINDLNLDVIDAVFYKRSGKKIKDELSTVFVMLKMEEAFGKIRIHPEDTDVEEFKPGLHTVFGIKDLDVQMVQDEPDPVFQTRYLRVISSGEELYAYSVDETIHLKYIAGRWYITESERIIEGPASTQEQP